MRHAPLLALSLAAVAATTAVPAAEPSSLRVARSLGAVQCGSAGTPPAVLAGQLRDAGIGVTATLCGSDGRMRPARCGTPDGRIGVFEIAAGDAAAAAKAGFTPLAQLPDARVTPCGG